MSVAVARMLAWISRLSTSFLSEPMARSSCGVWERLGARDCVGPHGPEFLVWRVSGRVEREWLRRAVRLRPRRALRLRRWPG
jgi:hypothetical protein